MGIPPVVNYLLEQRAEFSKGLVSKVEFKVTVKE
jgi:hypothetical protein